MKEARIESVTVSTEHFCAMCDDGDHLLIRFNAPSETEHFCAMRDDGDLLIRFNAPSETAGICLGMSGRSISELADELYTIKARMSVLGIDGWKN